jgi:hypothetical protein
MRVYFEGPCHALFRSGRCPPFNNDVVIERWPVTREQLGRVELVRSLVSALADYAPTDAERFGLQVHEEKREMAAYVPIVSTRPFKSPCDTFTWLRHINWKRSSVYAILAQYGAGQLTPCLLSG